jgi:thiol-disulfide isomerase/thioredoxin
MGREMRQLSAPRLRWGASASVALVLIAALASLTGCARRSDLKSLAAGEMKSLTAEASPAPAPQTPFVDAAGKSHTLAEFKGKVAVVNLWATWCGPCVIEMPTLAKLETADAAKGVAVVPVSVDSASDRAGAAAFIAKRPPLSFYNDPTDSLPQAFNPPVDNLPTTLILDKQGRVRARLSGGADWSSAQAQKVIDAVAAMQ